MSDMMLMENGGEVYVTATELVYQNPDEEAVTIRLSDVRNAQYTRPGRADYCGALMIWEANGTHVLKVIDEDGVTLRNAMFQAEEDEEDEPETDTETVDD